MDILTLKSILVSYIDSSYVTTPIPVPSYLDLILLIYIICHQTYYTFNYGNIGCYLRWGYDRGSTAPGWRILVDLPMAVFMHWTLTRTYSWFWWSGSMVFADVPSLADIF